MRTDDCPQCGEPKDVDSKLCHECRKAMRRPTLEFVAEVRRLYYQCGLSDRAVGDALGISEAKAHRIRRGQTAPQPKRPNPRICACGETLVKPTGTCGFCEDQANGVPTIPETMVEFDMELAA